MICLGIKGAALAALGEIAALPTFFTSSFGERKEGVKLGESTLNAFLFWLCPGISIKELTERQTS